MLLQGIHIPLTTPFHPDGRLNLPKLAANIARYSKSPAVGLLVLGPSGEPTLLSDEETREVLRTAATSTAPEKVLLANISRDSVRSTLALAEFAAEQHYDAILLSVPSIQTANTRELLLYFQSVADRSPLPVLLHSDRTRSISLEAATELATHPQILGILTAASPTEVASLHERTAAIHREVTVTTVFAAVTERMKRAAQPALLTAANLTGSAITVAESKLPLRTRTKSIGFQIITSNTQSILESLRAGATGAAPAFAACAPQACFEVYAAWKDDNQSLAEEKQARLNEAAPQAESTAGNLKFACDLNGYFGGQPRSPHLPPTGDQRAILVHLLKPLRN
jgi:4-hydroxy-2-oxoglutarate aldolase